MAKIVEHQSKFKTNIDESNALNFGIGDVSVVIEILRNRLYENKIQSLVQEYVSNSRDAARESNSNRPIEIHIPTRDVPEFRVRDYGFGITPDRMANVFILYGASTKRNTNTQTGQFGIGAKSAFAYTDSFKITTFIDGVKRVYIAHIGANQNGRLDLLSEDSTTELNGTEISIAVKIQNISEFVTAIERATMFWTEQEYPVFVGLTVGPFSAQRKIGLTRFMDSNLSGLNHKFKRNNETTVVIDGIQYPYPSVSLNEHQQLLKLTGSETLNIFIPNGLVSVGASREKIDNSDATKAALKQVFVAAISDFERAKKKWESKIVDISTMLKAIEEQCGFRLSTEKSFDFVSLRNGVVSFQTLRTVDEGEDGEVKECLFEVYGLTTDKRRRLPFNILGENRYYMPKKGSRSIVDINDWIARTQGVSNVNLITVLAQRETTIKKDGEETEIWKRDKDLAEELIQLVERLGYKNIEDVVSKVKKEKVKRKAGVAYEMSGPYENQIDISDLDEDDDEEEDSTESAKSTSTKKSVNVNETWIYFIGRKGDYDYNAFSNFFNKMKEFKEVDRGFRFLEKDRKKIEADPRFIEWKEFKNKWVPGNQMIFNYTIYEANGLTTAYKNVIDNYVKANSGDVFYRACKKLSSRPRISMDYTIREQIIKTKLYKDTIASISTLNKFIEENLPFLNLRHSICDHNRDYIIWALDKAAKDGKMLVLPSTLL